MFLIIYSFVLSEENTGLFYEANEFYLKKDYEKSAELYEHLIKNGYVNSQTFYNLGNSYFRPSSVGL